MKDSLFGDSSVTHTIRIGETETELKFRCVSLRTAFKLKDVAKPLAQAIGLLFSDASNDRSSSKKDVVFKQDGAEKTESSFDITGTSVEMADFRAKQREKVIASVFESLESEKNQQIVCEIIFDSIRKDQPDAFKDAKDILDNLPLPAITGMIVGVAKANKDLFGPLGGPLAEGLGQKLNLPTSAKAD